jgi:hypothetical protein
MMIVQRESDIFTKLVSRHHTLWALAAVGAGYQSLFRIISNEDSKNGMAPMPSPIPAHHWDPNFATAGDWGHYGLHAGVKYVGEGIALRCLPGNTSQFGHWNISDQ